MQSTLALVALALLFPATAPTGDHLKAPAQRLSPTAASSAVAPISTNDSPARGAITMEARQLQGAEAIEVDGSAPGGAVVTLSLFAVVSSDIPTILVSRHDVVTDVNGHFAAVVPIASAYERGTILQIIATSSAGIASAQSQLLTVAPNAGTLVPLEQP